MSAFIVGHDVIDVLVTFAIDNRISYRVENINCVCEPADATKLGKLLMRECERSVQYRYPNDSNAELPGTMGERASNYVFKRDDCFREFVRDQVDNYVYQSCETNDWEQSTACRILIAISNELEKTDD